MVDTSHREDSTGTYRRDRPVTARIALVLVALLALALAACGDDTGGDTAVPETTAVPTTQETTRPDSPEGTNVVVTDSIDVGGEPVGVAVSDDAVWVANGFDGTVSRIG